MGVRVEGKGVGGVLNTEREKEKEIGVGWGGRI